MSQTGISAPIDRAGRPVGGDADPRGLRNPQLRLRRLGLEGAGLKWPNDLVWQNRKLGGILQIYEKFQGGDPRQHPDTLLRFQHRFARRFEQQRPCPKRADFGSRDHAAALSASQRSRG